MISQHSISILSKAQLVLECLLPTTLPLPSHKLIYVFLTTESIKLYHKLNKFILNNGILIQNKGGDSTGDNWIKNWNGKQQNLKYSQIIAQIINILRPIVYLTILVFQKRTSYKAFIVFIVLDYLRTALQKPAQRQIQKFQYLRRTYNTISKFLFSAPFYDSILKPKLLMPLMAKIIPNNAMFYRLIFYLLEVKSLTTLTI